MIGRLVIFGASGDLTGRFLLPALAQLLATGQLPDDFTVLGAAQEIWDDDTFGRYAAEQLDGHAADVPNAVRGELLRRLQYRAVDVTDPASVAAALAAVGEEPEDDPVVAYLALPTGLIAPAVQALGTAGLRAGSRVAVEKPFGEDLQDAQTLNALLGDVLGEGWEEAVFRVDHALGMTPVRNLLPLRFTNRFPEVLFNSDHVDEVAVLWEETLALEGRAAFYDRAGALKDVIQNHIMQVFCMVAMEPPEAEENASGAQFTAHALRRSKVALLRSVRQLSVDDGAANSRRARYTGGRLADSGGGSGQEVPDYTAEEGVDPSRNTETFAEVVLTVENDRWAGTRFRLRAGKALAVRRKGILVKFRPPASAHNRSDGDQLWIGVDGPNDITLSLNAMPPQNAPNSAEMTLTAPQPESELSPYAHVLLDVLEGGSELSVGGEESELAWRILGPVLEAWDQRLVPMEEYRAGTYGPG
jgi:glucose-6-phosphate 1-dehydrogenase